MTSTAWICALLSGLAFGSLPSITQSAAVGAQRQLDLLLRGSVLALAVIGMFALGTGLTLGSPAFLGLALAAGALSAASHLTYFVGVLPRGPVSISWSITWTQVLVIVVLGWGLLGEAIYASQFGAIACLILALILFARRSGPAAHAPQAGFAGLLLLVVASGAGGGFLVKLAAMTTDPGHPLIFAAGRMLVLPLGVLAVRRILPAGEPAPPIPLHWCILHAAVTVTAIALSLVGLGEAPASLFSPVQAGLALASGVGLARLRGERPGLVAYGGAACALAAVGMSTWKCLRIA